MRITEHLDGAEARRILIGMVVDPVVLGRIAPRWQAEGLFAGRHESLIASWAVKHFLQHGQSPGRLIQGIYESWANAKARDKGTVQLVEKLLTDISAECDAQDKSNSEWLIDLAGKHFDKVAIAKLMEQVQADVDAGDVDHAHARLAGFRKFELGVGTTIDVLRDVEAMKRAFEEKPEALIKLPGAYGEFFDSALERDSFVSFLAPAGRGKTFFLIDLAWRAMLGGLKVAFFEMGDLTEKQIMRRFGIRAARKPRYATKAGKPIRWPKTIKMPPGATEAVLTYDLLEFDADMSWQAMKIATDVIIKNKAHTDDTLLRLEVYPARTKSVRHLRSILADWERDGWVPDAIFVDYPDIMAPVDMREEGRDRVNTTWLGLNAIRQELHCSVIVATQSNAAGFDADKLDMKNFSEDNRKNAHVTCFVGISQSKAEKTQQVYRLNMFKCREQEFDQRRCLYLAACLPLANPSVRHCFQEFPPPG